MSETWLLKKSNTSWLAIKFYWARNVSDEVVLGFSFFFFWGGRRKSEKIKAKVIGGSLESKGGSEEWGDRATLEQERFHDGSEKPLSAGSYLGNLVQGPRPVLSEGTCWLAGYRPWQWHQAAVTEGWCTPSSLPGHSRTKSNLSSGGSHSPKHLSSPLLGS